MKNLSKCTRCNTIAIDEEYLNHDCLPEIKDIKKIKVAACYISKNWKNHDGLEVLALDGMRYELEIIPEDKEKTKIPYKTKPDKDLAEP